MKACLTSNHVTEETLTYIHYIIPVEIPDEYARSLAGSLTRSALKGDCIAK